MNVLARSYTYNNVPKNVHSTNVYVQYNSVIDCDKINIGDA